MVTLGPTKTLRPRDSEASSTSYETDASGNLVCPTDTSTCPTCPSNQECYQQARTSTSCAKYVCVDKTLSSSSSVPVGGIVGGVVGGVALLCALAFLYYKYYWRKKHPKLNDLALSEIDTERPLLAAAADDAQSGEKGERPVARRVGLSNSVTKNHRLLAYESFMRPQARYTKRTGSGSSGSNSAVGTAGASGGSARRYELGPYSDNDMLKRNSVATTISTTNASNILPIAYIPGVTIRPTKNNTRLIYSYETDLIFSDMNAIENALIVADRNGAHQKSTMTAIRAQPKLVNVARIDEDDEDEEEDDTTNWDQKAKDLSVGTALYTVNTSSVNVHNSGAESEPDSDVDSDIVEIGRATSTRRPREVLVDTDLINLEHQDQESGSFILDISGPGPEQKS